MATKDANLATIAPLSARPSKEDEIRFIRSVVEAIPADSYLSSLFVGSVEFIERSIRDDFGLPSIMDLIDQYDRVRRENATHTAEIERLKATIKDQQNTITIAAEECQRLADIAHREKDARESAEATIKDLEAQIEVFEADQAVRDAVAQYERQKELAENARARLAAIRGPE